MCTIVAPVFAVDAEGDSGQHRRIGTERTLSMRGVDGMHPGAGAIRRHARPVKGAPYSAKVVSERQQNLADGNQIANKTSAFSYRDSAGRTRQEMHNAKGEVLTVAISDPVAGVVLMLDTRTKTGTRISTGLASNLAANHAADLAANLPPEERKATLEAARAGRTAAQRGQAGARRTRGHHHSPCRRRRHAGDGGRIESPNLRLGPLAGAMADMTWAAKATSKELGTRDIEGIKAEGELRSYDIPAGKVVAATPSRYPTRAGIRPNCG